MMSMKKSRKQLEENCKDSSSEPLYCNLLRFYNWQLIWRTIAGKASLKLSNKCNHDNWRNICIVPHSLTNRLVKNRANHIYRGFALFFIGLLVRLCGTVQIFLWLSRLLLRMSDCLAFSKVTMTTMEKFHCTTQANKLVWEASHKTLHVCIVL